MTLNQYWDKPLKDLHSHQQSREFQSQLTPNHRCSSISNPRKLGLCHRHRHRHRRQVQLVPWTMSHVKVGWDLRWLSHSTGTDLPPANRWRARESSTGIVLPKPRGIIRYYWHAAGPFDFVGSRAKDLCFVPVRFTLSIASVCPFQHDNVEREQSTEQRRNK